MKGGKIDREALKIALLCAFAYAYPVITATYVDAHIHHDLWGVRNYWMGYWVALGAIFPFFFAYMFNRSDNKISIFSKISRTALNRYILTFLSIFVPIILVLWLNFGPEYPHNGIFSTSVGYGLLIATKVYVKNKYDYINNESMSEHAQIERLKSEYKTLLHTSTGLTVVFTLFCLIMYEAFLFLPRQYTNNPNEQVLLFNSYIGDLFVGIVLGIIVLSEIFIKAQYIKTLITQDKDRKIDQKLEVFIGYAREDYVAARRLYEDLKNAGLDAWLDKESLKGGQRWKDEIEKAIRNSHFFVAVLSKSMIQKRGHVQVEIAEALKVSKECPSFQIFIIPIRLDECDPSNELSQLAWVDMFPNWDDGLNKILVAIFSQGRR
ncbi:MAG: toll/interleukin-1 receptor domain-containing protein [Methanothrix sp.]|nr:toll/interleukin-1 receptor domain-containing protein [Methanothrix sp.]MDD4446436.1 toll/interleukin-1 receptor domain-containing protein [Methanothrix sp.]